MPHLCLTLFEAQTAERVRQVRSDAMLLSAHRSDVVPLLGRASMLREVWAWMESEPAISIRPMTGSVGRGIVPGPNRWERRAIDRALDAASNLVPHPQGRIPSMSTNFVVTLVMADSSIRTIHDRQGVGGPEIPDNRKDFRPGKIFT